MQKFTLKTYHVNSKGLLTLVSDFVNGIIENFNVIWDSESQRDAILEVIDEHLQDLVEQRKIDQWNVICDGRNNTPEDVKNKITHLHISYRQRNCYNTTELKYKIENE